MYISDKYNMSRRDNIFLAKRNIVGNIYNSARLEGLDITFPETYAIYYKSKIDSISVAVVSTVLNLKHAWQYLLENINEPLNLEFILNIHRDVALDEALAWGVLRNGGVGITGTDYRPPIPVKDEVIKKLDEFEKIEGDTERAVERMLWMMKQQLFWDGNKRTSMLIANKDMISHGRGIITVPDNETRTFSTLLSKFYSFDEKDELKKFIYEKCIDGIVFEKDVSENEPILE